MCQVSTRCESTWGVSSKTSQEYEAFIECLSHMNVCQGIEHYSQGEKRNVLIVFYDMMILRLLIWTVDCWVICWGYKTKYFFGAYYTAMLHWNKICKIKHCTLFHHEVPKKPEIHQIAIDHFSDFDYKDFMELYRKCISKKYSLLVIDTTLTSDNQICLWKNLFWGV